MDVELKEMSTDKREKYIREFIENNNNAESLGNNIIGYRSDGLPESKYWNRALYTFVELPETFPEKPPIIIFKNTIFHPNISETGKVCEKLVAEKWKPEYEIWEVFTQIVADILINPSTDDKYVCQPMAAVELKSNNADLKTIIRNKERERYISFFLNRKFAQQLDECKYGYKFHGPPNSLYENRTIYATVIISSDFPDTSPTTLVLKNSVFHPNISKTGQVNDELIKLLWKPDYEILGIFQELLWDILVNPNLNERYVMEVEAAQALKKGYENFAILAKNMEWKKCKDDYLKLEFSKKLSDKSFGYRLRGPAESLYECGFWYVRTMFYNENSNESPKIIFKNKIFHPNISETGEVNEKLIQDEYSSEYEIADIFTVLLKNLLITPNLDPEFISNPNAAKLFRKKKETFAEDVRKSIKQYATKEIAHELWETDEEKEINENPTSSSESQDLSRKSLTESTIATSSGERADMDAILPNPLTSDTTSPSGDEVHLLKTGSQRSTLTEDFTDEIHKLARSIRNNKKAFAFVCVLLIIILITLFYQL